DKAGWLSDRITHAHLTECLQRRQLQSCSETVKKERVTIVQLFAWACAQGHLQTSPAAGLPKIKGSGHRAPSRTVAESEALRPRGQYVVCRKGSAEPLNPDAANTSFWQPLRGTEWQIQMKGKWNYFKIGFHTYRHSFASNLAAAGVDQRIIDLWMGHQTEAMR